MDEPYKRQIADVLQSHETSEKGLNKHQVTTRLKKFGPNVLKIKTEPLWRKLIEPFANVFMLILFFAGVISYATGKKIDAFIILGTMAVSGIIYYAQKFSSDRILRALQKYENQMVDVIRDNETVNIDSTQLVPGDILLLGEGEKVPADARIIHSENARVDESLLTGESVPISKQNEPLQDKKEIYEQTNMLFRGSFVVAGQVKAVVVKTGNHTQFGQIAKLSSKNRANSPVQDKIDKLVSQIVLIVTAIGVIAFGLSLIRGIAVAEAIRFVLTLSVSAVPESLPVAITVILVFGMRRMAKQKALVRNMRAIENIGAITTIATDKTGTLTKNKLSVEQAITISGNDAQYKLALPAILSVNKTNGKKLHDPLDSTIEEFANPHNHKTHHGYELINSIPFEHKFAMSGNVWKHKGSLLLAVKGAPEQIIHHANIEKKDKANLEKSIHSLTSQGYRVIAIATTHLSKPIESFESLKTAKLKMEGLLAIADQLRPEAKPAIAEARHAGVSVRMITGDHYETAYHIGKQLDMVSEQSQVIDSRKFSELSESELNKAVTESRVFARVIPEQKYKILNVLKKQDITAMTGDGVNDVPALSNAHVGITMGSGSQIAKEAGDIVLLDDNFKSIVVALREGRIIFSNIRRMLFYLLSTNAGEVLTFVGALIIGMPLPLVAVQILWVNLVTDSVLVIPLGLEPGESNVMKRPPRDPNYPILDTFTLQRMALVSLSMAMVTLIVFSIFEASRGLVYAQTLAFNVLVVMQWANAFNARSELDSIFSRIKVPNKKLYVAILISALLQILAIYGPLSDALHSGHVAIKDLLTTSLIAVLVTFIVSELFKIYGRSKFKNLSEDT